MGNNPSRNVVYDKYYESLKRSGAKNEAVDMSTIDPYEVLGLDKNFEWEDLKASYKRLAKLVHPDKGGSEILFNTVTECFRMLAHEYKAREEKSHIELRNGAMNYFEDMQRSSSSQRPPASMVNMNTDEDTASFIDRFNRTFEKNRMEDDDGSSIGYGAKMAASSKVREDFSIPRVLKKYDANAFNKVFDAVTLPQTKEVVKYVEPEPLPLAKKIQYTELGKGATDDFSSTQEGEGRRTLQYTDYMKAYTTTRLVDPRAVQERQTYRNVDEYEVARTEATTSAATQEEIAWRRRKEKEAEAAERDRLARLKQRDTRTALHFERVNRAMLG